MKKLYVFITLSLVFGFALRMAYVESWTLLLKTYEPLVISQDINVKQREPAGLSNITTSECTSCALSAEEKENAQRWISDRMKWLNFLPFSNKLKDYLNALGVNTNGAGNESANTGLIAFNLKLQDNDPCFKRLVNEFNMKINHAERDLPIQNWNKQFYADNDVENPLIKSLGDNTSDFKAGWLWQAAMKFADQDPNLAMFLIGQCGHDNVDQGIRTCPKPDSLFYTRKSLGEEYDISDELVDKVIQTQAPTLGGKALPSKYYHVLGGAYASCILVQSGMPKPIVDFAHRNAIDAYRSKTICMKLKRAVSYDNINSLNLNDLERINQLEQYQLGVLLLHNTGAFRAMESSEGRKNNRLNCIEQLSMGSSNKKIDKNELDTCIQRYETFAYRCDNFDINNTFERKLKDIGRNNCPKSWPKETCDKALAAVKTWVVDFEWTRAQHRAGIEFAKDHCTPLEKGKTATSHACVALEKIKSRNFAQEVQNMIYGRVNQGSQNMSSSSSEVE